MLKMTKLFKGPTTSNDSKKVKQQKEDIFKLKNYLKISFVTKRNENEKIFHKKMEWKRIENIKISQ